MKLDMANNVGNEWFVHQRSLYIYTRGQIRKTKKKEKKGGYQIKFTKHLHLITQCSLSTDN